jgi:hypothetical protein
MRGVRGVMKNKAAILVGGIVERGFSSEETKDKEDVYRRDIDHQ